MANFRYISEEQKKLVVIMSIRGVVARVDDSRKDYWLVRRLRLHSIVCAIYTE